MFRTWLANHTIRGIDFSAPLLPRACDRAFWEGKYDGKVIAAAEGYLGFDWPVIKATDYMAFRAEGDRIRQEAPHFARRKALCLLVTAEIMEHKGRFIPDILNGVFAVCEETYWGLSAHWPAEPGNIPDARFPYTDLFAAETASMLAWTDYMLHAELADFCPEIIGRIDYELQRRIIDPYLSHRDFWWMGYGHPVNNWTAWILSNLLSVFLLAEKRRYVLDAAIAKMMTEMQHFYDGYAPDGGCDEGSTYWAVAGGCLFEFLDQLYTATGGAIDFFTDEKVRNIGRFEYHVYIGNGYFINYADGSARLDSCAFPILYRFGKRIGDERLAALAKEVFRPDGFAGGKADSEGGRLRRSLRACACAAEVLAHPDFVPEESAFLPDLQVAAVRRGPWFLSAKGGDNDEGHNHNDVGNFIAYDENRPVLIDAGVGVYSKKTFSPQRYEIWTMQSAFHNCPDINGAMQCAGPAYAAGAFSMQDGGIRIAFADAYPKEAGIQTLDRLVTADGGGVTVEDRYVFSGQANTVEEHLMTTLPVSIEGNACLLDRRYRVTVQAETPPVFSWEDIAIGEDARLAGHWQTDRLFRLCIGISAGKTAAVKITIEKI